MYKASQKAEWDEHARITTATEIGEEAGLQKGLQKGETIGLKKGRKEGLQKGAEKKAFAIAKNLLAKGIELQVIVEATGLSEEDIKKL